MSLKIIQTGTSKHEEMGAEFFTGIIKEDGRSTAYTTVINNKGIYCDLMFDDGADPFSFANKGGVYMYYKDALEFTLMTYELSQF